jgi:solute carrier family 10 (sodium/bile acid cotransporter), member 7
MTIAWFFRHWFILGLFAAVGLAFVAPGVGAPGGPLRPEFTTNAAVALLFFLQGLGIPAAALQAGALNWRLHTATQLFIFVALPAAVIALDAAAGRLLPADLRTGFLFLAVLPTTVSTCVVFAATARGNVAGAIFNAAFANIAGVIITPLWMTLLAGATRAAPPVLPIIADVALLLVAPLLAGQVARNLLARRREPDRVVIGAASGVIVLFVVFTSFANSASTGAFDETGPAWTLVVTAAAAVLFVAATAAAVLLGRALGFAAADRRTLLFCAPQKTLAAGAPMGHILFAGQPGIGLILLPLLVYHIVQLAAGAALAERLRRIPADGA